MTYMPLARAIAIAIVLSLAILRPGSALAQINMGGGGGGASLTGTNEFTGTNNFTSTVKVYQTTTHSGNNWLGLGHDGTNAVLTTGTGGINLPNGTQGGPMGLSFAVDATTGYRGFSAAILGVVSNTDTFWFTASEFQVPSTYRLCWSSTGVVGASSDLCMSREAAGKFQLGTDLNGAAIAQTVKSCDGITGTDVAGCDHIEAGGRGTGAGAPGDYDIQTAKDLATGTTAQTLFDRHYYRGKAKAVTESSATTFVSISVPTTLTGAGGTISYCIHANDATDVQERCGDIDFAAANKAGTMTCSTPNILGTEATVLTAGAGTLTNTFTFVANGTSCDMKANAVSSLTQTVLDVRYAIEMHGSGLVVP